MWQLRNINLSAQVATQINGAPLAVLQLDGSAAPIARIDFRVTQQQPGVSVAPPIAITVTVPPHIDNTNTAVNIPLLNQKIEDVRAVTSGGTTFIPAANPLQPQPGEFTYTPASETITIYPSKSAPLTPGMPVVVVGSSASAIKTDYVSPSLFDVFYGLPAIGDFTWGAAMEQHPSGNLRLQILKNGIATLRERFKKGTELTIAGIGFSVSSYKERLANTFELPQGFYEVEISLSGKWDAPKYNLPVALSSRTSSNAANNDPDCTLNRQTQSSSTADRTSVHALAARNRAVFNAAGSGWKVIIPQDSPAGAAVSWLDEARSRLRQNGCFLNLCDPDSVRAQLLSSTNAWSYQVPQLEVSCLGDPTRSGSYFGYAAEYPNVKLNAQFITDENQDTGEDTQGNRNINAEPRWKQRKPNRTTLWSGSTQPAVPYENTTVLKNLSHNWDTSGDTKTLRRTTTENGLPVLEEEWIYGFAYTSIDIVQSDGRMYGNPANFWQIVQYKRTEYLYDSSTGYALGSNTTGWRLARFEIETDANLFAYGYAIEGDQQRAALYKFQKLPIVAYTRYLLAQFLDYYEDAARELPPIEIFKVCLRDGSSELRYKKDPTYVTPMFVLEEMSYTSSFASVRNPDFDPENVESAPEKITGEESLVHVRRQILPSSNTTSKVGGRLGDSGASDRYIEFRLESSAQGAGFNEKSLRESFEEFEGQPGSATKKPPSLEKVEPESQTPSGNTVERQKYEYRLTTSGYSVASPDGGSFSAPHAESQGAALTAATTDLHLKDIQQSVQFSCSVPFNAQLRPLDRVRLATSFDTYQTRIASFSNSVTIQGQLHGYPLITSPGGTVITCGIDRQIPVGLHKVRLPKTYKPSTSKLNNLSFVVRSGLTLGQLISTNLKTRGNY